MQTAEPRVLTWGAAAHGQLGHGRRQREEVRQPTAVGAFNGRPVLALSCSAFHSAAIVGDGSAPQLLTWGRGTLGVLGHGDEEDQTTPIGVAAFRGLALRAVSCGPYQTGAITQDGALYCWGWRLEADPNHGEWRLEADPSHGAGAVEGYVALPQRVGGLSHARVRAVCCGSYCCAAVANDGALYTWGKGTCGQLGHGRARDVVHPSRVEALAGTFVWDARFGRHFLLVLTAQGDVHSCGSNASNVLGHADRVVAIGAPAALGGFGGALGGEEHVPRRVAALDGRRVYAIACGDVHCAALAERGAVYTWGSGQFGRLGHPGHAEVKEPALVEAMVGKCCVAVSCAAYATLVRTESAHAWAWGGRELEPPPPHRVRLGGAVGALSCGGGHYAAALGDAFADAADVALAREVGFHLPPSRELLPPAAAAELGPHATLVETRVPPDAEPAAVVAQLNELRALLAREERKRDRTNAELMALQQQLQQARKSPLDAPLLTRTARARLPYLAGARR